MRVEMTIEVVREDGDSEIDWEAAAYAMAHARWTAEAEELACGGADTARFVESMGLGCEVEQ